MLGQETVLIGKEAIDKSSIRRYAQAILDSNPIYFDEDFAKNSMHGAIIAPPTYIFDVSHDIFADTGAWRWLIYFEKMVRSTALFQRKKFHLDTLPIWRRQQTRHNNSSLLNVDVNKFSDRYFSINWQVHFFQERNISSIIL